MAFEHAVQLFDSDESVADAVAHFLRDGFKLGESMMVIVGDGRWSLIVDRLTALGISHRVLIETGQLARHSAESTLRTLMPEGRLDRGRFETLFVEPVRERRRDGRRLRVFGEMVDLLAHRGNFANAQALEELWNEFGDDPTLTLFCGYLAVHFGDPATRPALRAICQAHSELRSNPRDALGSFLLAPDALRG
jgi:hypothetical protein